MTSYFTRNMKNYCLHSTDWCKIVNVDYTVSWQRNTIRLLSELETEVIKWIYTCLCVRYFMNRCTAVISATFPGGKILVLCSCLFIAWRWKQKVYPKRLYPLTVATISKIRAQRHEFYLNPFTKPVSSLVFQTSKSI